MASTNNSQSSNDPPVTPRTAYNRMLLASPAGPPTQTPSSPTQLLGRRERDSSPSPADDEDEAEAFGPPRAPATRQRPTTFNAVGYAKTLVANKKRKTEHASEVLSYAQAPQAERDILHYDLLVEVRNLLSKDKDETVQGFTLDKSLSDTIREYVHALLLSPIIATYMLDVGVILKFLVKNKVYPESWDLQGPKIRAVRKYAGDTATNKRNVIKTKIGIAIEKGQCLDLLCKNLLGKASKLRITAPLRGRIAWIRKLHALNPDKVDSTDFWEFIDDELKELRNQTKNEAVRFAFAMAQAAKHDETVYVEGSSSTYDIADTGAALSPLQTAADDVLRPLVLLVSAPAPAPAAPAAGA